MFKNQTALFKHKQWSGWKLFLDDLLHRESVQAAWQLSKHTFDTDFQSFMDSKIRARGRRKVGGSVAGLKRKLRTCPRNKGMVFNVKARMFRGQWG